MQGQQDLALQRLIEILSIAGALALAILIMGTLFGLMSRSHTVMRKKLAARDGRE